jgi:hypothetical protein
MYRSDVDYWRAETTRRLLWEYKYNPTEALSQAIAERLEQLTYESAWVGVDE